MVAAIVVENVQASCHAIVTEHCYWLSLVTGRCWPTSVSATRGFPAATRQLPGHGGNGLCWQLMGQCWPLHFYHSCLPSCLQWQQPWKSCLLLKVLNNAITAACHCSQWLESTACWFITVELHW